MKVSDSRGYRLSTYRIAGAPAAGAVLVVISVCAVFMTLSGWVEIRPGGGTDHRWS